MCRADRLFDTLTDSSVLRMPVYFHEKRHKGTETHWTKMGGQNYFGCKNQIKGDTKSKLTLTQEVTPAPVHDSQPTDTLLEESDKRQPLYGDSGDWADQPDL